MLQNRYIGKPQVLCWLSLTPVHRQNDVNDEEKDVITFKYENNYFTLEILNAFEAVECFCSLDDVVKPQIEFKNSSYKLLIYNYFRGHIEAKRWKLTVLFKD